MTSQGDARDDDWKRLTRLVTFEGRQWILIALAEADACAADLRVLLGYGDATMSKLLEPLKLYGLVAELQTEPGRAKPLALTEHVKVERCDTNVVLTFELAGGGETRLRFQINPVLADKFDRFGEMRRRFADEVDSGKTVA